jgi:hypothetical protein
MTKANDNAARFAATFNAGIGSRAPVTDNSRINQVSTKNRNERLKTVTRQKAVEDQKKKKPAPVRHITPPNANKLSDNPDNVRHGITGPLVHEVQKGGILGAIERNITGSSPIGRAFDILSRPNYALTNAMVKGIQGADEEGGLWSAGDDAYYGLYRGLNGVDKTGYGDVLRTAEAHPDAVPGWVPTWFREDAQYAITGNNNPDHNRMLQMAYKDQENQSLGRPLEFTNELNKYMSDPTKVYTGKVSDPSAPLDPTKWTTQGEKNTKVIQDAGINMALQGAGMDFGLDPMNAVGAIATPAKVAETVDETGKVVRGVEAAKTAAAVAGKATATEKGLSAEQATLLAEKMAAKADNIVLESGHAQRTIGDTRLFAETMAQEGALAYRTEQLQGFEAFLKRFRRQKLLDPERAAKLLQEEATKNPLVKQLLDAQWEHLKSPLAGGSEGNLASAIADTSKDAFDVAVAKVRDGFDDVVAEVHQSLLDNLTKEGALYKRAGISIPGVGTKARKLTNDHFIPIGPAKMYIKGAEIMHDLGEASGISKLFSYTHNFPGLTGGIAQRARSTTVHAADEMKASLWKTAPKLSRKEWTVLHEARKFGTDVPDHLDEAAKWLDDAYKAVWDEGTKIGVHEGPMPKNYVFDYFEGGAKDGSDIKKYKKIRKDLIQAKDNEGWGLKLKEVGDSAIKPLSNNGLENLNWYINDFYRKASKKMMTEELISLYGTRGTGLSKVNLDQVTKGLKGRLNMYEVPHERLTPALRDALIPDKLIKGGGKGTHWYLPQEVQDVLKNFDAWTRMGTSPELNKLYRQLDRLTTFLKRMNTLYFPSFHIRNAISDYLMGHMDGVTAGDWVEVGEKMMAKRLGREPKINIGGVNYDWDTFVGWYDKNASSMGYLASELPTGQLPTDAGLYSKGKNMARRGNEFITRASEKREDWGRMAHFLHAMREEAPKNFDGLAKDLKTVEFQKGLRKALLASTERVNKYHADYGALTQFEKHVMRRVIPFYTYTRRMLPVLLESMITNPSYFTMGNKFERDMNRALGGPDNIEARWDQPQWMRDIHAAPISGDWMFAPNDLLPAGMLEKFFGSKSPRTNAVNMASMLHPIPTAMANWAYNKTLFTGRDGATFGGAFADTFRPWTTWEALKPGSGRPVGEQIFRTGLGIPVWQLTDARKEQAGRERMYAIKQTLDGVSAKLAPKGYKLSAVTLKGQDVYRLSSIDSDGKQVQVIAESPKLADLEQIVAQYLEMPDLKKAG